jgi:hypothetical protein
MKVRITLTKKNAQILNLPRHVFVEKARYDEKFAGKIGIRVLRPHSKHRWITILRLLPVPIQGIKKLRELEKRRK